MRLRLSKSSAATGQQLAHLVGKSGGDIVTHPPEALSADLQQPSLEEKDEEGRRVYSSEARDTTGREDVRSNSADTCQVAAAWHRDARQIGACHARGERSAFTGVLGVGVKRDVDRQHQRDFRRLGPIQSLRSQKEPDPADRAGGRKSSAPVQVDDIDIRTRPSAGLHP